MILRSYLCNELINCSAALPSERYAQPDHTFGSIDNIVKLCVMYIKAKIWFIWNKGETTSNYCFPSDTKKSTDPIILWKRKSFLWDHVMWHRASVQDYTPTPNIWFWKKNSHRRESPKSSPVPSTTGKNPNNSFLAFAKNRKSHVFFCPKSTRFPGWNTLSSPRLFH